MNAGKRRAARELESQRIIAEKAEKAEKAAHRKALRQARKVQKATSNAPKV